MEFLKNQTFRTNVKFVKSDDYDKKLSLGLVLNCNHEVDKQLIMDIEKTIDNMLILNYKKVDDIKEMKKEEKEKNKVEEENKIKAEIENKKLIKHQEQLDRVMMKKLKLKNIF